MDRRKEIVRDLNEWANEERAYILFSAAKVDDTVFNIEVDGKGSREHAARTLALCLHRDDMLELLEEGNKWIAEHPEMLKKYLNNN